MGKSKKTVIPPKKPYTEKMFFDSTVRFLKGISAGIDKEYMVDSIKQNAEKYQKSGASPADIKGVLNKAKTAHQDFLRNYRKRELRRKMK